MWSVRKWYLDCVAEDGTTWIGYWGEARLASLRVKFASSFLFAGTSSTNTSLRETPEPRFERDRLVWSAPVVDASVTMVPRAPRLEKELEPSVRWCCLVPSADATVTAQGRTFRGRGYAEVLELSVAPWRLPIDTLRWGRALGEQTSLVWIQWRGAAPLDLIVRDGLVVEPGAISDTRVTADALTLAITPSAVLREGRLAPVLAALQPLSRLFPSRLTNAMEHRWRSRGTFHTGERLYDEGWVIHELVEFSR